MNLVALRTTLVEARELLRRSPHDNAPEVVESLNGDIKALDFYLHVPKCAGCGEALTPSPTSGQKCHCFDARVWLPIEQYAAQTTRDKYGRNETVDLWVRMGRSEAFRVAGYYFEDRHERNWRRYNDSELLTDEYDESIYPTHFLRVPEGPA